MLVVADTSPFIGLIKIGHVEVLPQLYGTIFIPPQVALELASKNRGTDIRTFIASAPSWLSVRSPLQIEAIPGIDPGECAAIGLALEINADLLLIDEMKGRQAAIDRRIPTVRTAAVLFDAANAGVIIDLRAAYEKLKATNFRVPAEALDALLKRHEALKGK